MPKNISQYVEEDFLDSCLNETCNKFRDRIMDTEVTIENVSNIMNDITDSSNITESTKLFLLSELLESVKSKIETMPVDESFILEFKGNDQKNAEFIECLKDLENLCRYFIDKIKFFTSCNAKMLTISNEILKNPDTFKEKIKESRGLYDEFKKWDQEAGKNINGNLTWTKYRSKVNKFNNKYSEVTMEEKKRLNNKLMSFIKEINSIVDPWCKGGEKVTTFLKNIDDLELEDRDYSKSFCQVFADFNSAMISEVNATFRDISYIIHTLKIEKENSIVYKVINKILK